MTAAYIDDLVADIEPIADESWSPADLAPVLAGTHEQPVPDLLVRNDGRALLYPAAINAIHGDSGTGKSWVAIFAIYEQLRRRRTAVLIDFEDTAVSVCARLLAAGATVEQVLTNFVYIRPQTHAGPFVVARLAELVAARNAALVVIDSIGEAFAAEGLDENKDVEVGPWYRRVARPLATAGAAILLVDHSTKAADNPLHPSGSKRKRAAVTGASYLVEATTALVKDQGGRLRLTCAKDRHGTYRRGEVVAALVMKYSIGGTMSLDLYEAGGDTAGAPNAAGVHAAQAAIAAAKAEGQPMSLRALVAAMKLRASSDVKRGGIELAVTRGHLAETSGANRARLFGWVSDMTEGSDR